MVLWKTVFQRGEEVVEVVPAGGEVLGNGVAKRMALATDRRAPDVVEAGLDDDSAVRACIGGRPGVEIHVVASRAVAALAARSEIHPLGVVRLAREIEVALLPAH